MIRSRSRALVLMGAALVAACSGHRGPSTEGEPSASSDTQVGDDGLQTAIGDPKGLTLDQMLARAAKKYAKELVADSAMIRGTLAAGERSDQLLVLRGTYCYRILGVGSDGVEDLDLFLYDPDGVQTQQDPGQDRFPVLGLQSEICPPGSGAYRLQALMYKGTGSYVLRVYRTP